MKLKHLRQVPELQKQSHGPGGVATWSRGSLRDIDRKVTAELNLQILRAVRTSVRTLQAVGME